MATANLALRFVVELVGLGALAYWGWAQEQLGAMARVGLASVAPLALAVVWAVIVAPNTANGLTQPQKNTIGTVLLIVAAAALALAGQPTAALAFGAVVVLNWMLLVVFGEGAMVALRSAGADR